MGTGRAHAFVANTIETRERAAEGDGKRRAKGGGSGRCHDSRGRGAHCRAVQGTCRGHPHKLQHRKGHTAPDTVQFARLRSHQAPQTEKRVENSHNWATEQASAGERHQASSVTCSMSCGTTRGSAPWRLALVCTSIKETAKERPKKKTRRKRKKGKGKQRFQLFFNPRALFFCLR